MNVMTRTQEVEVVRGVVAKFAPTPGGRLLLLEPLLYLLHIIPDTRVERVINAFMPRTFSVKAWLNDRGCPYIGSVLIKLDDKNDVFIKNKRIGHASEFLQSTPAEEYSSPTSA